MTRRSRTAVLAALVGLAACSDFATEPDRFPEALRLTPDTVVLTQGDTVAFQLTVLDQDGEAYESIPSWAPPLWRSSNTSILALDDDGVARSLVAGESRATVELAGLETRAVVRANPQSLELGTAFVYMTQSVQRRDGGVPLIAGQEGLLRVYVVGGDVNFFSPVVRATFYREGALVHTATLTLEADGVPETVEEGDARLSYDARIPGDVMQPGTGLVVEIDPDGRVPATAESELRIPATGELALSVRTVPPFRLRLVPVNQSYNGINSTLSNYNKDDVTQLTRDIYPFSEFDVDVRQQYTTAARLDTDDGWYDLIAEIAAVRLDDGSPRYYYGGFERPGGTRILGLGYVGYPVAIGDELDQGTIAHEIGHTMNLRHAPCGGPSGVDTRFPYPNGTVGHYGYDQDRDRIVPPDRYDLMTYCDPIWISDYNYMKVIEHRDTSTHDAALAVDVPASRVSAAREPVLVVQGGVFDGELRLRPVLPTTAPVRLPTGGRYTLEGLDARGDVLFSLSLEPRPLDHGGSIFLASIPETMAQPDQLDRLRLTGPEGVVERARSAGRSAGPPDMAVGRAARAALPEARWDAEAYPLAVVRDRATGRIVAMATEGRLALPSADVDRLDVVLSDGVQGHPARVTRR